MVAFESLTAEIESLTVEIESFTVAIESLTVLCSSIMRVCPSQPPYVNQCIWMAKHINSTAFVSGHLQGLQPPEPTP